MTFPHGQAACLLLVLLLPFSLDAEKRNKAEATYRISGGGRDPEMQKYARFMVSLRTPRATLFYGDNHYCAGTIVARDWVLTAAHCVMDIRKITTRPRGMVVVAGSIHRLREDPTTIEMAVAYIKPHPNFTMFSKNDIALLRLKDKLPENNPMVEILSLPSDEPPYGDNCITLGWGRMYYNGPLAAAVSHITVELFTEEDCKLEHPQYIPGELCASGDLDRDQDGCRGDSGGPLICNNTVTGVASYTIGCGSSWHPGLYTDVYYNIKWINMVINGAESKILAAPMLLIILAECLSLFLLMV